MKEFTTPIFAPSQLQEMLDEINAKKEKLPDSTLFGNLNGLVPPYGSTKHDNMDNPTNFQRK